MASDPLTLQQPIAGGGIESVNFFNGRLLTGGDLGREQRARQQGDARLGEALGDGVGFGLDIARAAPDASDPVPGVTVQPGLAINRRGQVLRLADPARVYLSRVDSTSFAASGARFNDCAPARSGTYVAGEGLYLLTIAPAQVGAGRAPGNSLGGASVACNIDRHVEAVQFRLLEIPPQLYAGLSPADPGFRNRIAYRAFGDGVLTDWATNLIARGARRDDLIDEMAGHGLTLFDVPLALIGFTGATTLALLDQWAVRRPLGLADGIGLADTLVAPRRVAAGRAMLHQFQDQLDALIGPAGAVGAIRARTHFPYLPAAGVLPRIDTAGARVFFGGMTVRGPVHLNSQQVESLVRESLSCPAIRSADNDVVWLYAVAQNRIAAQLATADPARADPYLIFASGNLAYRGDARFNLHRWDYANFALGG